MDSEEKNIIQVISLEKTNKLENIHSDELTPLQKAQRKYLKKYIQRPEAQEGYRKNYKKYYHNNKEEIQEKRKKKLEDPEFLEKHREQVREASRKYREKKKLENSFKN